MIKPIIYIMVLWCCAQLDAQDRRDYFWPFTGNMHPDIVVAQSSTFDFNELPMRPQVRNNRLSISRTSGSICDKEGNLLFYCNGCKVVDRTHHPMTNGDSLNHNLFYDDWLSGCRGGYRSWQDLTILPDPAYDLGYYIIHKPVEMERPSVGVIEFDHQYILYSYVDMALDEGKGAVTVKNDTILNESPLMHSHLTTIAHNNRLDWWIIQPALTETSLYYRILLDATGFSKIDSQSIGPPLLKEETLLNPAGISRFSPDGSKYAFFNVSDGLHLYDFDRETGLLSEGRYLDWDPYIPHNWAGSIAFSSNSRFIYITNEYELYQLDTWADRLEDGLLLLVSAQDEAPFFLATLAPDCKIYIRSGSSTDHMNVIHEPNLLGHECMYEYAAVILPSRTGAGAFPNFPPFRVDEEEKCDYHPPVEDPACYPIDESIFCEPQIQAVMDSWSYLCTVPERELLVQLVEKDSMHLIRIENVDLEDEEEEALVFYYNCNGELVGKSRRSDTLEGRFIPPALENYTVLQLFGSCSAGLPHCPDRDGDSYDMLTDCDDTNPDIYPGAAEICNGSDDDCDGEVDEGLTVFRYYYDSDGDGYGIADTSLLDCQQPSGYADNYDDCDDTNEDIYPGAAEILGNEIDEDCDGIDNTTGTLNQASSGIRIYPNPAMEVITIMLEDASIFYNSTIKIHSVNGTKVYEGHISRGNNYIEVGSFTNGIYLLEFTSKQGRLAHNKIIVRR